MCLRRYNFEQHNVFFFLSFFLGLFRYYCTYLFSRCFFQFLFLGNLHSGRANTFFFFRFKQIIIILALNSVTVYFELICFFFVLYFCNFSKLHSVHSTLQHQFICVYCCFAVVWLVYKIYIFRIRKMWKFNCGNTDRVRALGNARRNQFSPRNLFRHCIYLCSVHSRSISQFYACFVVQLFHRATNKCCVC